MEAEKAQSWDWQGCQEEGEGKDARDKKERSTDGTSSQIHWVVVEGQHSHKTAGGQRRRLSF